MVNEPRPLRVVLVGCRTAGTFTSSPQNASQYFICHAPGGKEILALHPEYELDIIFYELSNASGDDLALLERVCEAFSAIPVIAVVDRYSTGVAEPAFRVGAADVWEQGRFSCESFLDDVRQAIHLRKEEVELTQERSLQNALQLLQHRRSISRDVIAPDVLGMKPIKESMPSKFLQLTTTYGNLIDTCVSANGERIYRPDSYTMSQKLQFLASDLGSLRAGAGDVIDLHGEAVKRKFGAHVSHENGHTILIGLMSELAFFYRHHV
ncbi:MAG: hypothetical protein HY961_06430 [Ignavibacteriae bacterium]|nr:hypothetical protein [Ignavibacteriota bacterium]